MQGNLRDMGVADLIQHICQDNKLARLSIFHDGHQAVLFFKDGGVVHAELDNNSSLGRMLLIRSVNGKNWAVLI